MTPASRFRNAALIYNPLAGFARRAQRQLEGAVGLLEAHGMGVTLVPTTRPGAATALAREELERGRDLIIACGGDGTVNEIANGMVGSEVPLALLPAGTGNILAKEFGLPWNIWRAAEYIPRGVIRRIALGQALPAAAGSESGGRYFVSVAGAGADANIVYHLNPQTKYRWGMLAYWFEAFRQLAVYRFPEFTVRIGDHSYRAALLILGRTRHYGGPVQLTRRASLFRDEFEACLFPRRFPLLYLVYFVALQFRQLERFRDVRFLVASTAEAESESRPIYVHLDGELAGRLPMKFVIVADALSLLVPADR
jgi:YegS/Rv2252/BmrU family lipid kinase